MQIVVLLYEDEKSFLKINEFIRYHCSSQIYIQRPGPPFCPLNIEPSQNSEAM